MSPSKRHANLTLYIVITTLSWNCFLFTLQNVDVNKLTLILLLETNGCSKANCLIIRFY